MEPIFGNDYYIKGYYQKAFSKLMIIFMIHFHWMVRFTFHYEILILFFFFKLVSPYFCLFLKQKNKTII